jgi:hypothetical protein
VNGVRNRLGIRARGRQVEQEAEHNMVREPDLGYGAVFGPRSEPLAVENRYFWETIELMSVGYLGPTLRYPR